MIKPENAKSVVKRLLWPLGVYALVLLNWRFCVFRFSSTRMNYIFFLLILTIPFLLVISSLRFPKIWMKVTGIVCLLPMIILSSLLGFFTVISLPNVIETGQPALLIRAYAAVQAPHYDLVVYSGDGCWSVWQEKRVVPGILLVRMVHSSCGCDPQVKVLDEDTIRVSCPPDRFEELRLKRFVYF